jgi:hypothetical protein
MPAVHITSDKQYEKALNVLIDLGGTWQGVGFEDRYLLVSERQYQALVEAGVVVPKDDKKDAKHGKKSRKRPQS